MTTTLSYGSNSASGKARTALTESSTELGKTIERFSSGLRINSVKDDAAGVALSAQLNNSSNLYGRAVKNINDGISLVNLASEAVTALDNILTQIKELATQASNANLSHTQRTALDEEAQALAEEYDRIVSETSWNNVNLLDGSFDTKRLQADPVAGTQIAFSVGEQLDDLNGTATVGSGTFAGYTSQTAGTNPLYTETSDLDGDGDLDIVSVNNTATHQVLINNGSGSYSVGTTITSPLSNAYMVQAGDFDGDGDKDLITANYTQNQVTVFLGNGNGTFSAGVCYVAGPNALGAMLGDVDEDGDLDVLVSTTGGSPVVLLGNGNGTFAAPVTITTASSYYEGTLVDVDGDGDADAVTSSISTYKTYVALSNGNGTFAAAVSFVGSAGYSLSYGDFNDDGKMDLVGARLNNYINVLLGNGNGTFLSPTTYSAATNTNSVEVGDLNGDGNLDLFAMSTDNRLSIFLGNGNGTFGARTSFASGNTSLWAFLDLGDLNGDGVLDVAANSYGNSRTHVFLANSTTTTTAVDLSNTTKANTTISLVNTAISALRGEAAGITGNQSRLSSAVNYLAQMRDNTDAAYHRIVDVDTADEIANLVRLQIVQQGAIAVLAQANQQPERARQLLEESL